MNTKKFFGFLAVLVIAALAAWNVSISSKTDGLSAVSLANIEATASITEGIGDWWDSKVYQCVAAVCYVDVGIPGVIGYRNYGTIYNCESGTTNAHCWECDGCSARII